MSMFDKLVATDLAALGTDTMQRQMSVDASLAVVEARRLRPARSVVVVTDPSRLRALRVARLVAVMTLLVGGGVVAELYRVDLLYPRMSLYFGENGKAFALDLDYSLYTNTPVVPLVVGAIVALGYLLAHRISLRALDRRRAPASDVLASRVVAGRLASLATSIVGIFGVAIVCVIVMNPIGIRMAYNCRTDACWEPGYTEPPFVELLILTCALMARAIATELSPRIERYLRRLDGWVVTARIAAITALVTVMGVLWFAVDSGHGPWGDWDEFFDGPGLFAFVPGRKHFLHVIAWDVTLAAVAIGTLAILIGLACARETWLRRRSRFLLALEHRTALTTGVILAVGSWAAGVRFDYESYGYPAALGLRPILTATGGIAVLLVVAALTLRRRRRELALLSPAEQS